MEFSTLSVAKTPTSPPPFWGDAKRLVVVVATTDDTNVLVAYLVDPDHKLLVFETAIFADQLGTFFKFLIDGDAVVRDPNTGTVTFRGTRVGDAAALDGDPLPLLDIPAQQPPPTGPRLTVVLEYANVVSAGEFLAEQGERAAA